MRLTLHTAPAAEPLAVTDLEGQSNLGAGYIAALGSQQTAAANLFLSAVRQRAEAITRRQLITAVWDLILDGFPGNREPIEIPLPPLQSITSITYVDPDGATQTMGSTLYREIKEIGPTVSQAVTYPPKCQPGIVVPVYGESWPATRDDLAVVTIRFSAGYGAAGAAVPEGVRNWMLLNAAALWENRESEVLGKAFQIDFNSLADGLLEDFRIYRW